MSKRQALIECRYSVTEAGKVKQRLNKNGFAAERGFRERSLPDCFVRNREMSYARKHGCMENWCLRLHAN